MPYRHLFFDMDKTVTPARQPVRPHMKELLSGVTASIVIVSGGDIPRIRTQMEGIGTQYLGVNGNHAVDASGCEIWQNPPLSERQKEEIRAHIERLVELVGHELTHEWVPIEDRGSQVSFSALGNIAPAELKHAYDPDRSKRLAWLRAAPFQSDELVVKIGGSTTLDYFHKDGHKGANVQRLIGELGWEPAECLYFGDGLYPGGNDETVIGVIDTVPVEDEEDTYRKLKRLIEGV
jgi:hypothetical protein